MNCDKWDLYTVIKKLLSLFTIFYRCGKMTGWDKLIPIFNYLILFLVILFYFILLTKRFLLFTVVCSANCTVVNAIYFSSFFYFFYFLPDWKGEGTFISFKSILFIILFLFYFTVLEKKNFVFFLFLTRQIIFFLL